MNDDQDSGDWLDEITLEDLPESYREIVGIIGLRPALKLSRAWGGTCVYIPKTDKVLHQLRDRKIRKAFTGQNHRDLARKFGLSETWIRTIVESEEDDRQVRLFPEADSAVPLPP